MPVSVPISYELYARQIEEGGLDLVGVRCPGCRATALVLTSTRVRRSVVLRTVTAGQMPLARVVASMAMARCLQCRHRVRVLPADVLPRKVFSLPVVEGCCDAYLQGGSLRKAVQSLGSGAPAHSTVHGWTDGLGAHALMRPGADAVPDAPCGVLLSETKARHRDIGTIIENSTAVDPRQHRSEGRGERIGAVGALLAIAMVVTGLQKPETLTAWRQLSHQWSVTAALSFRSALSRTPIEQQHLLARRNASDSSQTTISLQHDTVAMAPDRRILAPPDLASAATS